ncbi:unnamed protein product [Discula destructiva]
MAEEKLHTYRGNCHCAAFIFEVKLPAVTGYNECNCSICTLKGYVWLFPDAVQFQIVKGSVDELRSYKFGGGDFAHRFCGECGTAVLGQYAKAAPGYPALYINARTIQGLDIWSLKVETFDGKALPPPYAPPVYDGPEPIVEVENGKTYHGSCHCGAVKLAVKLKPLETWDTLSEDESVVECNCSICVRGAFVWCYPHKDQSVVFGRENLSYRIFSGKTDRKGFCKHCGVTLFNEANPLTDEQIAALSEGPKKWREESKDQRNINLRILHDFDFKTLKTQRLDGWSEIPGDYVDP